MDPEQQNPAEGAEATPPADTGAEQQPTPEQQAEDAEWTQAAEEMFPGLTASKKEEQKSDNEQAKPDQKPEAGETPPANPAPEKPDAKSGDGDAPAGEGGKDGAKDEGDGDGDEGGEEDGGPDITAAQSRLAARKEAQRVEGVQQDIREKLFKDQPTELRDGDGDPIRSVEDVMKLVNPRTGEPFTEQEAGTWLIAAQQQLNQQLAQVDREVARVAEVNMDLKDQADIVLRNYGSLLKEMPDLGKRIWEKFNRTLVKDPDTGIIKDAPIPLEEFYDDMLKPYVDLAHKLEANQKAAADKAAADKAAQEAARKQNRQDRSDIYGGGGKAAGLTEDEKEWAEAANQVFGNQLPRK